MNTIGKLLYGLVLSIIVAMAPLKAMAQKSTWDQILETKVLRIGAVSHEPWYLKDISNSDKPGAIESKGMKWRGLIPPLAQRLAKDMNVKLEIVETTWGGAIAALQANQIDVMFILDPTPTRALAVDFVYPILWTPYGLLANDNVKAEKWSDINKTVRIATVSGTDTEALAMRNAPHATFVRFESNADALTAFQTGRVDAYSTATPSADVTRAIMGKGKTLVPKPITAIPAGAAVRKEVDPRWKNYLQVAVEYYYNTGVTSTMYRDYLTYRGLNPDTVISIRREEWK